MPRLRTGEFLVLSPSAFSNIELGVARVQLGEGPKLCAICDDPAWTFCPADDAFLCGDCDKQIRQIHGANLLASKHQRMMLPKQGKMCQRPLSSCGAQEMAPPQLSEAMPPWTAEHRRDAWRAKNIGSGEFGIPMSECISDHRSIGGSAVILVTT
jgi:hypothetical protein